MSNKFIDVLSASKRVEKFEIKCLVIFIAITPPDLRGESIAIDDNPVIQSIRSIPTGKKTHQAVVALIDDGTKNGLYCFDSLIDGSPKLIKGIAGRDPRTLKKFLDYALRYAFPNWEIVDSTPGADASTTKVLFWWIGHGNGYEPRFRLTDYGSTWKNLKPKCQAPFVFSTREEISIDSASTSSEPYATASQPEVDGIAVPSPEPGPQNSGATLPTDELRLALSRAKKILKRPLSAVYLSNCMNFSAHLLAAIGDSALAIAGYPNYNWFLRTDWTEKSAKGPQYRTIFDAIRKAGAFDWPDADFADFALKRLLKTNFDRLARFNTNFKIASLQNDTWPDNQLPQGQTRYPALACITSGAEAKQLKYHLKALGKQLVKDFREEPVYAFVSKAVLGAHRYDTPHPFRDSKLGALSFEQNPAIGSLANSDALMDLRHFVQLLRRELDTTNYLDAVGNKRPYRTKFQDLYFKAGAIELLTENWYFRGTKGRTNTVTSDDWDFSDSKSRAVGVFFPLPQLLRAVNANQQEIPGVAPADVGKVQALLDGISGDDYFWDARALPFFFPLNATTEKPEETPNDWARFVLAFNRSLLPTDRPLASAGDIKIVTATMDPIGSTRGDSETNDDGEDTEAYAAAP